MAGNYKYDELFLNAADRGKGKVCHENHPPDEAAWGSGDDTLSRQGGHGICKGLATAWVIAMLNGVEDACDLDKFKSYFLNVLKFHGTYIKDYGRHIDSHLARMIRLKLSPGLQFIKKVEFPRITAGDLASYNWGAYASVWHHDIGFGRRAAKFYIMEPNFGLFKYDSQDAFLSDANALIEARRHRKGKGPQANIAVWYYGKAV